MKKTPILRTAANASPRERVYPEEELIQWINDAKEAAYLGTDQFERFFVIAEEKMLCRLHLYWTEKADMAPRIAKMECVPLSALDDEEE